MATLRRLWPVALLVCLGLVSLVAEAETPTFTTAATPADRAAATAASPRRAVKRVPVIDVTDLYHPPQDPGDNFDLIAGYALPEIDLRAVILDVTEAFRQPVATFPSLFQDPNGPRDPGIIPVLQLNCVFNRQVPCGAGPFQKMQSPDDKMLDAPPFQQQGIELMLRILEQSSEPVEILSFGSARPIAVAFNRDPNLFFRKVRRIHLSAGSSEPGYLEWNVGLDPNALVRLLRSSLPIAVYPCATKDGPFALGRHNSYWRLPDLRFVEQMDPALRRYLGFAFGRLQRTDFLHALDHDLPAEMMQKFETQPHNVWETAVWLQVSRRRLVQRADQTCRIIAAHEILPSDQVLPNDLRPCRIRVQSGGEFRFELTGSPSNFWIYDRGDAAANERAFREALPAWYVAMKP